MCDDDRSRGSAGRRARDRSPGDGSPRPTILPGVRRHRRLGPGRGRLATLARVAVRSSRLYEVAGVSLVVLGAYYVMPMNGRWAGLLAGVLVAVFAIGLIPLTFRRVRRILVGEQPVSEAMGAIATVVSLLVVAFASVYYVLGTETDQMNGIHTKTDSTLLHGDDADDGRVRRYHGGGPRRPRPRHREHADEPDRARVLDPPRVLGAATALRRRHRPPRAEDLIRCYRSPRHSAARHRRLVASPLGSAPGRLVPPALGWRADELDGRPVPSGLRPPMSPGRGRASRPPTG